MNICLKVQGKEENAKQVVLDLSERLPVHLSSPCQLSCIFQVHPGSNYYLLRMKTRGTLEIICQRCLHAYQYQYEHSSEIAVCKEDNTAERLSNQFECIVANSNQVDLKEIITDELHLFLPEKHLDFSDCDGQVKQFIYGSEDIIS